MVIFYIILPITENSGGPQKKSNMGAQLQTFLYTMTEYRCVTDRQTDRQMDGWTDRQPSCHGIVHTIHMHHAVKTKNTKRINMKKLKK